MLHAAKCVRGVYHNARLQAKKVKLNYTARVNG